jgi:hypothetical protein
VAERTLRKAILYLSNLQIFNLSKLSDYSLTSLRDIEKNCISINNNTNNCIIAVNISKLLYQSITSCLMCNQTRIKQNETNIINIMKNPDCQLSDLAKPILRISMMLYENASITEFNHNSILPFTYSDNIPQASATSPNPIAMKRARSFLSRTFSGVQETKGELKKSNTITNSIFAKVDSDEDIRSENSFDSHSAGMNEDLPTVLLRVLDLVSEYPCPTLSNFGKLYSLPNNILTTVTNIIHLSNFNNTKHNNTSKPVDPLWVLVAELFIVNAYLSSSSVEGSIALSTFSTADLWSTSMLHLTSTFVIHHSFIQFLNNIKTMKKSPYSIGIKSNEGPLTNDFSSLSVSELSSLVTSTVVLISKYNSVLKTFDKNYEGMSSVIPVANKRRDSAYSYDSNHSRNSKLSYGRGNGYFGDKGGTHGRRGSYITKDINYFKNNITNTSLILANKIIENTVLDGQLFSLSDMENLITSFKEDVKLPPLSLDMQNMQFSTTKPETVIRRRASSLCDGMLKLISNSLNSLTEEAHAKEIKSVRAAFAKKKKQFV